MEARVEASLDKALPLGPSWLQVAGSEQTGAVIQVELAVLVVVVLDQHLALVVSVVLVQLDKDLMVSRA
jgi:hypothetical protein